MRILFQKFFFFKRYSILYPTLNYVKKVTTSLLPIYQKQSGLWLSLMESKTSAPLHQQVDIEAFYSQDFEDLLLSLPKEVAIEPHYAYQYQGFWYNPPLLQGIYNCQKYLQPRKNDLPRSQAPRG